MGGLVGPVLVLPVLSSRDATGRGDSLNQERGRETPEGLGTLVRGRERVKGGAVKRKTCKNRRLLGVPEFDSVLTDLVPGRPEREGDVGRRMSGRWLWSALAWSSENNGCSYYPCSRQTARAASTWASRLRKSFDGNRQ